MDRPRGTVCRDLSLYSSQRDDDPPDAGSVVAESMKPIAKKPIVGSISEKDVYTLKELKQRMGLSTLATWRARWGGLKVRKMYGRRYVLGKDFITFLEERH